MLQLSPNTPNVGHSLCFRLQELTMLYIALKQSPCFFVQETATVFLLRGEINFLGLSGKQAIIGLIMFLKIKKQRNMQFKCADGSVFSHGLEKELHYILLLVPVTYYFLWLLLSAGGSG